MKKCLVTGVSGLIGSHLVRELCNNWSIIGLSRSGRDSEPKSQRIEHLALDLSRTWDQNCLPNKIDAVIHLAQSEYFREFPNNAEDVFQVNTVTTLRLLDYALHADASKFILASSGGIYGYGEKKFSEDVEISLKGDLGLYLGTKLCSEILVETYTSFISIIVLRFFFVYGPGQRRSMLIPRLVKSVLDGKPIILEGQDGLVINPTYVADAVTAINRSLQLEGSHKINVGGPEVLTLRAIGNIIGQAVDREPKFEVKMDTKPRHLVGDLRKMSRLLGSPNIKFKDGMKMLIEEFIYTK